MGFCARCLSSLLAVSRRRVPSMCPVPGSVGFCCIACFAAVDANYFAKSQFPQLPHFGTVMGLSGCFVNVRQPGMFMLSCHV
jgi:hypothetical protein